MPKNTAYVIREDTFNEMQKEAGIILTNFDFDNPYTVPPTSDILATTTGGLHLRHETPMKDNGEGVDNCPEGVMELMEKDGDNISLEFTSITFNTTNIAMDIGAADTALDSRGHTRIYPRRNLKQSDFRNIICLFPMTGGGMCGAILSNVLSSNGLDIQTSKGERGTQSVTLVPHVSIHHQGVVPIEYFFIPAPELGEISVASAAGSSSAGDTVITISNYTLPSGHSYKYKVMDAPTAPATFDPDIEYGDLIGADWTTLTLSEGSATLTGMTSGKYIVVVAVDGDDYIIAEGHAVITAKASA